MFLRVCVLICAVLFGKIDGAVPYEPQTSGSVLEPWRWQVFTELRGQGVLCMTEASDGAFWFGTQEGVQRYDGLTWTAYKFDDAPVNALSPGRNGIIFAGTELGIHQFLDGVWQRIFPVKAQTSFPIYDLMVASDGRLWAGTGLGALVWDHSIWSMYTTDEMAETIFKMMPDVQVETVPQSIAFDRTWSRPEGGIGALIVGGYPMPHRGDLPMVIGAVAPDGPAHHAGLQGGDQILHVDGKAQVSINAIEGEAGQEILLNVRQLSGAVRDVRITRTRPTGIVQDFQVHDVLETQDGALWFALNWGEVIKKDVTGAWFRYGDAEGVDTGIRPRLTQDRAGRVWVVSDDGRRNVNRFENGEWIQTRLSDLGGVNWNPSVLASRDGTVWVGGRLGRLHAYRSGKWRVYNRSPEALIPATRLVQILEASDGALWLIGKGQDALRLDYGTTRWTTYEGLQFQCEGLDGSLWFTDSKGSVVQRNGSLWVRYDQNDGLMSAPSSLVVDALGTVWAAGEDDSTAATAQFQNGVWKLEQHKNLSWRIHANAVFKAQDGSLWFGAESGWASGDGHLGGFLQRVGTRWIHQNALRYVYGIGQSGDGTMWLGSHQLTRLTPPDRWQTLSEPEHLNSYVHSIAGGAGASVWVGMRTYGVYQFDGQVWRQHDSRDGLADNTVNSLLVAQDNTIWAGTEQGVSRFDGRQWQTYALPRLLSVHFEQAIRQTKDGALWVNLEGERTIRYTPDDVPPEAQIVLAPSEEVAQPGNVPIEWMGADPWHATRDEDLTFSYRVDGAAWSSFSKEKNHTFLTMKSGTHILEVKTRDRDFNEDLSPARATFVVLPPIYLQGWFLGLMAALLAVIGIQTGRAKRRGRRLREANETLEKRVDERTAELAKTVDDLQEQIQERQLAEEQKTSLEVQLHQAQKMEALGQLAGGVAHDFNNTLTVIIGNSELMQLKVYTPDELKEKVDQIYSAGERGVSLTRQLLAFCRQQVFDPKVLDLNHQICNIDHMLQRLIGEPVALRMHLAEDLGRIEADPGQIDQVIINLVVNARDAMPDSGRLTLETANVQVDDVLAQKFSDVALGDYVMLAVRDSGTGIDADTLRRIFEPFFTTKGVGKGTGLGLSTVHGIVTQSRGFIDVESTLNQGTTFFVYFPLVAGEVTVITSDRLAADDLHASETILVVEDDRDVRDLTCQLLEHHGYTALDASNSGEALLTCERHDGTIDLMLSDVVMPQMSGPELAQRVAPLRPNMRVLYMSGYLDDAISEHGLLMEPSSFLLKPFNRRVLLEKVREVLDAE
ncbi:MAG: response regulator [Candidatus Latescibacteria bacterium]|nr:response regulator [Candidatus Latescibacterota bacterium]